MELSWNYTPNIPNSIRQPNELFSNVWMINFNETIQLWFHNVDCNMELFLQTFLKTVKVSNYYAIMRIERTQACVHCRNGEKSGQLSETSVDRSNNYWESGSYGELESNHFTWWESHLDSKPNLKLIVQKFRKF